MIHRVPHWVLLRMDSATGSVSAVAYRGGPGSCLKRFHGSLPGSPRAVFYDHNLSDAQNLFGTHRLPRLSNLLSNEASRNFRDHRSSAPLESMVASSRRVLYFAGGLGHKTPLRPRPTGGTPGSSLVGSGASSDPSRARFLKQECVSFQTDLFN